MNRSRHDTDVHFQKCYGVLAEIFEANASAPSLGSKFGLSLRQDGFLCNCITPVTPD